MALLSCAARAGVLRTQTISLHKGWNSIHLQVSPTNSAAASVFGNLPITIAATYTSSARPIEYLQNPGQIRWKNEGWAVWYAPNRADAFLSTLSAVLGNRTYLIYAQQDCSWNIEGEVLFEPTRWRSDSFNLVGFCLDEQSPPTFDKFFSGSPAHSASRVYRLVGDQWMQVTDRIHTTMRSGEACWVFCKGRSEYQGPLLVKAPGAQRVNFGPQGQAGLLLANQSNDPINIQVETVSNDAGLPLAYTLRAITVGAMDEVDFDLPRSYALPSLEAGVKTSLWLRLRRERMINPVQSTLLKITTDSGVQCWVPVTGARADLAAAP